MQRCCIAAHGSVHACICRSCFKCQTIRAPTPFLRSEKSRRGPATCHDKKVPTCSAMFFFNEAWIPFKLNFFARGLSHAEYQGERRCLHAGARASNKPCARQLIPGYSLWNLAGCQRSTSLQLSRPAMLYRASEFVLFRDRPEELCGLHDVPKLPLTSKIQIAVAPHHPEATNHQVGALDQGYPSEA